jgi:hypothetical protein
LPDFFGTTYQNGKNIPKWSQNIPNGRKMNQMGTKYTNSLHTTSQDHPKFTQFGIFGLKIYHLATLSPKCFTALSTAWHYLHTSVTPFFLTKLTSVVGSRVTRCVCQKVAQNIDQSIFVWKLIHSLCRGKSSPIICAISVIFAKTTQTKQSHYRRKFAQSGHPGSQTTCLIHDTLRSSVYNL